MEICKENDQKVLNVICNEDGTINSGHGKWSYLKLHFYDYYVYLSKRFNDLNEQSNIREIIVRLQLGIEETPICPVCGRPVKFNGRYYPAFCSRICYRSDKGKQIITDKTTETNIQKYGAACVFASKDIQQKVKNTMVERYGVEHPGQNKDIAKKIAKTHKDMCEDLRQEQIKKAKQTCKERYGSENYRNTEKSIETCLERYGVEYVVQSEDIKNKSKQTCLQRYGAEYAMQSEDIKNKSKQTCLERYGVEFVTQTQNQKDKSRQTCQEKYGCDYAQQNEEISKQAIQTKKERYGDKMEILTQKVKQTKKERYGDENYVNIELIKQIKKERYGDENYNNIIKAKQTNLEKYGYENPQQNKEINNKTWETRKQRCNLNTSSVETNITNWLSNNSIKFEHNYNKDPRYPFHVDFYLNDFDTFIEIQGYWTHGYHIFNNADPADIKTLNTWKGKQYTDAINVWTVTDPLKRQTAKENKLNYLEIFTCDTDDAINQILAYLKENFNYKQNT